MVKANNQANGLITKELKELRQRVSELEAAKNELARTEAALRESETRYHRLLDNTSDFIYSFDLEGRFTIVNRSVCEAFGLQADEIVGKNHIQLGFPEDFVQQWKEMQRRVLGGKVVTEEVSIQVPDGEVRTYEVNLRPLYNEDGLIIGFSGISRNITERNRYEMEAQRANRALKVLSECNQMVVRTENEETLWNEVCRILVEDGGYRLAWVGLAEQDREKTVRPVAQSGFEDSYLEKVNITWTDTATGRGPTGTAIRMGKAVIARDLLTDPNFAPWHKEAINRGCASLIALPLFANGKPLGVLNIYAQEPDAFNPQEVELLKEMANDLAYGMVTLRTRMKQKQAEERIRRQLHHMSALRKIDAAIATNLELQITLEILLDHLTNLLGIDAADVLQLKPRTQTLVYIAGCGLGSSDSELSRLSHSTGLAKQVMNQRRIIFSDLFKDKESLDQAKLLADEGFEAYMGLPLIAKGEIKGVLEIFNRTPLDPDPEWMDFLTGLSSQAAIAIYNAELLGDLKRMNLELSQAYETTIEGWSRTLDLRDEETEGHSKRVTEMTLLLARTMGMSEEELMHVRYGALLHDIGKMGVPDHILLKPEPLNEKEWEIMRRHTTFAYELLSPINYLQPALDIPYCHHEKWDGTGYPRGLKGEEIPLVARIFAVADVWDALRSDRPYREAWSEEEALEYIREQAGKHFDPQVVEVFLGLSRIKSNASLKR